MLPPSDSARAMPKATRSYQPLESIDEPRSPSQKKSPSSLRRGVKERNSSSLEEITALDSASSHGLIGTDSIGMRFDWMVSSKPSRPTAA
jgi:hypothetical protein